MDRRQFFFAAAALTANCGAVLAAPAPKEFRIGYQKNGLLLLAKQRKLFDARFAALGASVKWVEFSFGPPLLEALGTGAIDFGTTGDAPPVFAQAAGQPIVYVSVQEAAGSGSGIVVPPGSAISSLAELKGKRVGFAKASSAHNLTIAALEKAGLSYQNITPVYLAPADAAAAFQRGAIDAWTIWDPYFAIAENQPGVKVLALGRGIAAQNSYFLANRAFATEHPDFVAAANDELVKVSHWASANREEVAKAFTEATGIALEWQRKAVERTEFDFGPVSDNAVAEQQRVADRFFKLGLIPAPIKVRDIVWSWTPNS